MSGALTAVSTIGTFAQPALQAVPGLIPAFIRQGRSIGKIIPDVTIEEQHSDRVVITQHPIADGSQVADHAYIAPATLTMRCGWTNANPVGAAVGGFIAGGIAGAGDALLGSFSEQRCRQIYQSLLTLQQQRQPFDVTTGKRAYKNMMIVELAVRTDHTTEYSLMLECHMQEVFRVVTRSTQQPAQGDQAAPDKTASTTDSPPNQPNPVDNNNTLLRDGWGALKGAVTKFLGG
jgi:hypothetical protein